MTIIWVKCLIDFSLKHSKQPAFRAFLKFFENVPVIGKNIFPLCLLIYHWLLSVDKVASVTVLAMTFFEESIAGFSFVWVIYIQVYFQLMGPVSELAFLAIRAKTFLGIIFTKAALDLGLTISHIIMIIQGRSKTVRTIKIIVFLAFCGGLWFVVVLTEWLFKKVWFSDDHFL